MTNQSPLELSVIIPAYDAGSFIEDSLAALEAYLKGQNLYFEIIVVDDGSRDDTLVRLHSIAKGSVRVFSMVRNQGKGAAIKRGIEVAEGRYIVTTDADIPYGPESIMHCYTALRKGTTLSIGDRTLPGSQKSSSVPLVRGLLSMIYSRILRSIIGSSGLRDIQCGLKGFRSDFAKMLLWRSRVNRFAFDLEIILFAVENRIPVSRIAVVLHNNESSSFRILLDPLSMLWDVLRIVYGQMRGHYRVGYS